MISRSWLCNTSKFNQLFSDSGETDPISQVDLLSSILPNIYDKENEDLENPISEHEIIEAIWTLHPNKSPGPDRFTINFYRASRDIIKEYLNKMLS